MEWYLLSLLSAVFSALAAILEKKILFKQETISFTFILSIFNVAIASVFLFTFNIAAINQTNLIILFINSILNAFAFLFVMYSLKNLEISRALPMLILTPGLIAIAAFFIFGETLTLQQISGLLLLMIGIYTLNIEDKQKILDPFIKLFKTKGYHYVFAALIMFTIYSLLSRFLVTTGGLEPTAFMFFQHIFYAIIFFAMFLTTKNKIKNIKSNIMFSGKLLFLLALATVTYRYLEITAIKSTPATALVVVLKRISVLFAVAIGGKLFNEKNLLRKIIATIILLIGVTLII